MTSLTDLGLASLGSYGGPTETMALLPGSPAIGAGHAGSGIPSTDQRGQSRSAPVDIGAFQSQGFKLVPATASTPQTAVIGNEFANTLLAHGEGQQPCRTGRRRRHPVHRRLAIERRLEPCSLAIWP